MVKNGILVQGENIILEDCIAIGDFDGFQLSGSENIIINNCLGKTLGVKTGVRCNALVTTSGCKNLIVSDSSFWASSSTAANDLDLTAIKLAGTTGTFTNVSAYTLHEGDGPAHENSAIYVFGSISNVIFN